MLLLKSCAEANNMINKRGHSMIVKVFAGFMIFATILFLVGPFLS